MIETCFVCEEPVDPDAGKFDEKYPVYTDDGVYCLGCEDKVFESVYCSVPWGVNMHD